MPRVLDPAVDRRTGTAAGRPTPTGWLARLGYALVRRRSLVLLLALVAVALAVPFGAGVEKRLSNGGFFDPTADATRADAILAERFSSGVPNLVLLATADTSVDSPDAAEAGRDLVERLSDESGVLSVVSYWTEGAPQLRSDDGRTGLVLVRLGGDEDQVRDAAKAIAPRFTGQQEALDVAVTGTAQVSVEIERRSAEDLVRAELISAPLVLIVLLLVFRSAVAATMPLVIGAVSVLGTFVVLRLLSTATSVSVFSVNITTALGLGLAIDYSLFILTRFREELARGQDVRGAVVTTVRTAGRTVVFSAVTVALSLSALLVFPLYFLRSFAYGGIAVVALAALGAVVVLPALLAVVGERVNRYDPLKPLRPKRARGVPDESVGFWHKLAVRVMRRPVAFGLAVVALLIALGLPFLRVDFGLTDDRVLPAGAPAHLAAQQLRDDFSSRDANMLSVVLPEARPSDAELDEYAQRLSTVDGVTRVDAATGSYADGWLVAPPGPANAQLANAGGAWLSVIPSAEPYSDAGTELVEDVRAVQAPSTVLVGGQAALLVDTRAALWDRLPEALLIIVTTTLVLLFLFTGSVLIPAKAVLLNLLSLSASFGAMVYVFQEGNLRWLVGDFTVTGLTDITMPVLIFCVAFGLSMDYEVFLLSRIREEFLATGDNTRAVALGLERTGRLVTAAAILIALVLLAFATSGLTFLKLLGVVLALAVVVDATLVRGVLVPAFMRLAGRANWWAPRPLRRLHDRVGLAE